MNNITTPLLRSEIKSYTTVLTASPIHQLIPTTPALLPVADRS